jgi:hypothetical protein
MLLRGASHAARAGHDSHRPARRCRRGSAVGGASDASGTSSCSCSRGRSMGLVNRVVPRGSARSQAEALALQIAAFPQASCPATRSGQPLTQEAQRCMLADRRSAHKQWTLPLQEALTFEFDVRRAGAALVAERVRVQNAMAAEVIQRESLKGAAKFFDGVMAAVRWLLSSSRCGRRRPTRRHRCDCARCGRRSDPRGSVRHRGRGL